MVIFTPANETEVDKAIKVIQGKNRNAVTVMVILEDSRVRSTSKIFERTDLLVTDTATIIPSLVKHFLNLDGNATLQKLRDFISQPALQTA